MNFDRSSALRLFAFVLCLLPLNGCFYLQQNAFLRDDFATESVRLPYSLVAVRVGESRVSAKMGKLKVPLIRWTSATDDTNAVLTPDRRALIQSETVKYFSDRQRPVTALVELEEGELSYEGKGFYDKERVTCRVRMTLMDGSGGEAFLYATGESTYTMQSPSTTSAYAEKLFDKALRAAIYQAAKSLKSA